jgi:lysophospholipase
MHIYLCSEIFMLKTMHLSKSVLTFLLSNSFTENQLDLVFANNLAGATYGNGTIDAKWPACLACGVILRSLARVNMSVPDVCHACFQRHCWNGTRAETPAAPIYNPKLILDPQGLDYAEWNATVWN